MEYRPRNFTKFPQPSLSPWPIVFRFLRLSFVLTLGSIDVPAAANPANSVSSEQVSMSPPCRRRLHFHTIEQDTHVAMAAVG
jgi:hypothetical protein